MPANLDGSAFTKYIVPGLAFIAGGFAREYSVPVIRKFIKSEEKTVTRSDETGHVYSSWRERFDEAVSEDKTLGDLVDELEFVDRSVHYHLPMSVYDENGDRIKI